MISTSQLLPLITLWLLAPESKHVFCLAFDKSSKAIDYERLELSVWEMSGDICTLGARLLQESVRDPAPMFILGGGKASVEVQSLWLCASSSKGT